MRPLHGSAGALVPLILGALLLPAPVRGAEASDPMRAEPRCIEGMATQVSPAGLPVLVGPCAQDPEVHRPSPPLAAGPADCLLPGYDDRCETWVAPRYDGPWASQDYPGYGSTNRVRTVLAHPTRDLVFVGGSSAYTNGGLPDSDFVEIAYRASTGQPVWTATYPGYQDRTLAYQHSFALSPDGERLYALGRAAVPGEYAYAAVVVAFDAVTGDRLWEARPPLSAEAIETGLTTLPDGTVQERIFLAGSGATALPGGGTVAAGSIAALDAADGSTIWNKRYPGTSPYGARFNELVVAPDGSMVYAAGGEHNAALLVGHLVTVAFRAADGATAWAARDERAKPDDGTNGISDMAITPDGSRVLVAALDLARSGSLLEPSGSPILIVSHDASSGAVDWRRSYGGPVDGETHFYFSMFQGMMDLSPDGETVVATAAINSHNATGTVAYEVETGTQLWGVESDEHAYVFVNYVGYYPSVAVSEGVAFVSNRRGIGLNQYRTVTTAYDLADGGLRWTARLGTNRALFGGNDAAPTGDRVFVAAADQLLAPGSPVADPGLDSVDIVTVAYDG